MYTPDKPDLWKAYQFCAERQLVFHLQQAHTGTVFLVFHEKSRKFLRNTMVLFISL